MKAKIFEALNPEGSKVKCQIVATFQLNGRNYVFYTDNVNMYVGYYETKKIKPIRNTEEYNLLYSVYKSFKLTNFKHDFIDYGYTFYKGQNYKMIFDKYDGKRYFFELVDGKYKEISGEVKDFFDKKFNQEVIALNYYNNKFEKEIRKKKFKTKLKVGTLVITISLLSNVKLQNLELVPNTFKEICIDLGLGPLKVTNIDEINNLVKNNQNLTIEEKAFLLSLDDLYLDCLNNFHLRTLTDNILDLEIIYDKNNQTKYNQNETTKGIWIVSDNNIVMFDADSLVSYNYHVLLHEYMHAISNGGVADGNKDAVALTEGITELISSEYTSLLLNKEFNGAYGKQQTYVKMLAEIIGIETIKDAYFKHDCDIIYDALSTLTNEKDAYNLIRLINDEMILENKGSIDYYENKKDNKKNLKMVQDEIDSLYAKFYEENFGIKMENDLLMCSYIDSIRGTNTANYPYYKEGNTFLVEVKKNYVCKKLTSNLAVVNYYFSPGLTMRSNRAEFKLQPNGKYLHQPTCELYDTIPEYISKNKLTKNITDENKIIEKYDKGGLK